MAESFILGVKPDGESHANSPLGLLHLLLAVGVSQADNSLLFAIESTHCQSLGQSRPYGELVFPIPCQAPPTAVLLDVSCEADGILNY